MSGTPREADQVEESGLRACLLWVEEVRQTRRELFAPLIEDAPIFAEHWQEELQKHGGDLRGARETFRALVEELRGEALDRVHELREVARLTEECFGEDLLNDLVEELSEVVAPKVPRSAFGEGGVE
jgi:hypothetical protein